MPNNNKNITDINITNITNEENSNLNKKLNKKKIKTSIKKKKAKSLNNVRNSIKRSNTKSKYNQNSNNNTKQNKINKINKKQNVDKQKHKKGRSQSLKVNTQKGGNNDCVEVEEEIDSDLCSRDINELLSTNKKIFTYNQPGNQTDALIANANATGDMAKNGWGNNPGPPPDPSKCLIM
jgi:hypothetical protein